MTVTLCTDCRNELGRSHICRSHVLHAQVNARTAQQAAADASIDAAFGEIVAGPRQLPMPVADGPLGAGNPEGQRYLTDAMKILRARHVEFSHQAHHDLHAVRSQVSRAPQVSCTGSC